MPKLTGADRPASWLCVHDARFEADLTETKEILPTAATVREWLAAGTS